jgi:miniconductance mechanosensitive channel
VHYEKLQAEILDHVLAVLPLFDLRVFQEPTGDDLRNRTAAPRA